MPRNHNCNDLENDNLEQKIKISAPLELISSMLTYLAIPAIISPIIIKIDIGAGIMNSNAITNSTISNLDIYNLL